MSDLFPQDSDAEQYDPPDPYTPPGGWPVLTDCDPGDEDDSE